MPSPLNHNHLYYFWLAGKHRNLTQAAKELGLAQLTVSAQIRSLEEQLNAALLSAAADERGSRWGAVGEAWILRR